MINNPLLVGFLLVCLANNGGILHLILFMQAKNNLLERFNEPRRVTAALQVENCSLHSSGPLEDRASFWAKEHL